MTSPRRRRQPVHGARVPAVTDAAVEAVAPGPEAAVVAISLDGVLWLALIVLAVALRFFSLDRLPFSEAESARAFAAWAVSEGSVPDGWPGDVTAALTSHLFRIFGSSETVARIIPAIAGSALVASFWFAGRYAGRGVALLAAALIAISPLAVYASRSAAGFALGGFLSIAMVLSLLAYLQRRQPAAVVILAASFGLALGSDPVATSTAVALIAFVAVEATWRPGGDAGEALAAFRSDPEHWRPAALALATTLALGVAQFGTDIDRLSLAGLRQWAEMFDLPRDGLPWHYQPSLLLAYEWPLLFAGGAGFVLLAGHWLRGSPTRMAERLLVMWTGVALIVVAFATRRESGHLLVLLLPLSLLGAMFIEDALARLDWAPLKRWWPAAALALVLLAYALLQLSIWARAGSDLSGGEKASVLLALAAAAGIVGGGLYYLGRDGLALALPLMATLALPFLVHSSLSLNFSEGAEFATGARPAASMEPFRAELRRLAEERGAPVAVDSRLEDVLGWPLRDERVVFRERPAGSPLVVPAGEEPAPGFAPLGGAWPVAARWVPRNFDPLPTLRWFVYRRPYGNLSNIEVQILEPTQ